MMWLRAPRDKRLRVLRTLRLITVSAGWCLVVTACAAQVPSAAVVDGVVVAADASETEDAGAGPGTAPPATSSAAASSTATNPTALATTTAPPTTAPPTTAAPDLATTTTATSAEPTATSTTPATTTTSAPLPEAFGDGTHRVDTDVAPGRYELTAPGVGCTWQRLAGLSGEYRDLLASGNPTHHTVVDILGADVAFASSDCGAWTEYRAFDEPSNEFGPGTWVVGGHVAAGTYTAAGGEGCYWAILTSFDGDQTSIASIARPGAGSLTITIEPTDVGFVSDYCGDFVLSGVVAP